MSHPKNTTGSLPTQLQMLTTAQGFYVMKVSGRQMHLFSVNSNLPVGEAVNAAYGLLDAAEHLISDAIHNDAINGQLAAIRLLLQAGQALVGSCMEVVEEASSQGGDQ